MLQFVIATNYYLIFYMNYSDLERKAYISGNTVLADAYAAMATLDNNTEFLNDAAESLVEGVNSLFGEDLFSEILETLHTITKNSRGTNKESLEKLSVMIDDLSYEYCQKLEYSNEKFNQTESYIKLCYN